MKPQKSGFYLQDQGDQVPDAIPCVDCGKSMPGEYHWIGGSHEGPPEAWTSYECPDHQVEIPF